MSLDEIIKSKVQEGVADALSRFIHIIPPAFYTVGEIADKLKVDPETVSRMCRKGEMKHARFGRKIRISPEDFADYWKKNRVED